MGKASTPHTPALVPGKSHPDPATTFSTGHDVTPGEGGEGKGGYRYDLSHLAPIDRLPAELLIELFVLCTASDFDSNNSNNFGSNTNIAASHSTSQSAPHASTSNSLVSNYKFNNSNDSSTSSTSLTPLTLARVCKRWRAIVLSTPDVWRRLSLSDAARPIGASHRQARVWLAHQSGVQEGVGANVQEQEGSGEQKEEPEGEGGMDVQSGTVDTHPRTLDVLIQLADADNLLPLLAPLLGLGDLRRCRTLSLTGAISEHIDFARIYPSEPASPAADITGTGQTTGHVYTDTDAKVDGEVCHLAVTIRPPEPEDDDLFDDDDEPVRVPTFAAYPYPYAHDLPDEFSPDQQYKLALRITTHALPLPPSMLPLPTLTSLTLTEPSPATLPDPLRLLAFLACTPALEQLRYCGYPREPARTDNKGNRGKGRRGRERRVVVLQRLRVLVLRSTCAVRTVLAGVHAPGLRELYLEHTNMEFELHHVNGGGYINDAGDGTTSDGRENANALGEAEADAEEPESGESADEAHDFSQSPWSDHGTGMGLRSLLKRSHPPLEVLDMNYADMRTKDFRWCFERMGRLRVFRIVASDMSDRVVGLFGPYREGARSLSIEDGPCGEGKGKNEEAYSDGDMRVRMPRLTTLALHNCHRLSGDAVVAALGARVKFTDRVAEDASHMQDECEDRCASDDNGDLNHDHDLTHDRIGQAQSEDREGGVGGEGRPAVQRMSRVSVVSCADFQARHVMALLPVLGARLRTTGD